MVVELCAVVVEPRAIAAWGITTAARAGAGGSTNVSATIATIAGLTITDASTTLPGGGIFNGGTLTVTNCVLSDNSAGFGGGIDNAGTLTVTNSTLSGNSASQDDEGGGIENLGTLTLTNSTLTGNTAGNGGGHAGEQEPGDDDRADNAAELGQAFQPPGQPRQPPDQEIDQHHKGDIAQHREGQGLADDAADARIVHLAEGL